MSHLDGTLSGIVSRFAS